MYRNEECCFLMSMQKADSEGIHATVHGGAMSIAILKEHSTPSNPNLEIIGHIETTTKNNVFECITWEFVIVLRSGSYLSFELRM